VYALATTVYTPYIPIISHDPNKYQRRGSTHGGDLVREIHRLVENQFATVHRTLQVDLIGVVTNVRRLFEHCDQAVLNENFNLRALGDGILQKADGADNKSMAAVNVLAGILVGEGEQREE